MYSRASRDPPPPPGKRGRGEGSLVESGQGRGKRTGRSMKWAMTRAGEEGRERHGAIQA